MRVRIKWKYNDKGVWYYGELIPYSAAIAWVSKQNAQHHNMTHELSFS